MDAISTAWPDSGADILLGIGSVEEEADNISTGYRPIGTVIDAEVVTTPASPAPAPAAPSEPEVITTDADDLDAKVVEAIAGIQRCVTVDQLKATFKGTISKLMARLPEDRRKSLGAEYTARLERVQAETAAAASGS